MTTICITGDSPSALAAVSEQFRQGGVVADKPLQRDASINLAVWHQRVLAGVQKATSADEAAIQPSRLWEQLAVDLLLGNLDSPLWGWTDPASVALLDFWAGLDDSIRFVLVCRSREQAVAEWLCASADERSEAEVLAHWQRQQQALLRFQLHHPARSMLVWADEAQTAPQALMAQIRQQWGLDLELSDSQPQFITPRDAVLRQLAAHIVHQHPESAELDGELHATVLSLTGEYLAPHTSPEVDELIVDYRRLLDRSAEQAALETARAECEAEAAAKKDAQTQVAELTKVRDAEAKAKAEALQQRDAEAKGKAEAQTQLKDAQQEGELLLQQLHLVQEELEKQFLQHKEDQAQHQKQAAELTKARDAEVKAKAEALKQRDAEAAAKKDAQKQVAELTKARDSEAKAKAEALQQRDAEVKAKVEALKERDAEAAAKNDAQQEGELLLQQLHLVQEELEKQFLQHKEDQAQHQKQAAELTKARDAEAKAKAEALQQRDTEAKAKSEALKQRDAESAAKKDAQTQVAELTKARHAEAKAKAEALQQRDAEAAAKKDAQQEGELLLQQLHLVQEELEKQFLQHKEDQAQHQKQAAELTKARDAEAKAKAEALKQRDTEAAAKKDAQQEGELLLQQLHLVQEELEQYYLKQQATQRDLDQLQARWTRLLKSQPGLMHVDAVDLASDGSDGKPLSWRLKQAILGGRQFEQLEFETVVEQGVAGFVWHRSSKGAGPLARWPASAKGEHEVTILPVKGGANEMRRAAHLVQLSTSDSDLMLALPAVLKRAMQAGQVDLAPQRRQELADALDRYQQIMSNSQALVRFDGASLVGQQSTEQRDVIAIAISALSLGALRLPGFEFQIQLNKAGDGSTESIHLIFGEQTLGAPFKGWFSNVPNTAGQPVMALHLSPQGWATADWTALRAEDRAFVQALTDSLAVMLVTLQAEGVRTERVWSDWLKQAASLRQWSRQVPDAAAASPAEVETLPTLQPPEFVEEEAAAAPEPLADPMVSTPEVPKVTRKPRAKPAARKTPAQPVVAPETAVAPKTRKRRAS